MMQTDRSCFKIKIFQEATITAYYGQSLKKIIFI